MPNSPQRQADHFSCGIRAGSFSIIFTMTLLSTSVFLRRQGIAGDPADEPTANPTEHGAGSRVAAGGDTADGRTGGDACRSSYEGGEGLTRVAAAPCPSRE